MKSTSTWESKARIRSGMAEIGVPRPPFNEFGFKDVHRRGLTDLGWEDYPEGFLQVLKDRGYVKLDKKRLWAEDKGRVVVAFLENFFARYVEYDFTASLEDQLDKISNNEIAWRDVWLGAALTSGLFAVGRYLIGKYIGQAALWESYGQGAKSLVALLVWVYKAAAAAAALRIPARRGPGACRCRRAARSSRITSQR